MRKVLVGGALLLVAFGVACLNYIHFGKAEDHAVWADEVGMPPPSTTVALAGVASVFVGGFVLGYRVAKRGDR